MASGERVGYGALAGLFLVLFTGPTGVQAQQAPPDRLQAEASAGESASAEHDEEARTLFKAGTMAYRDGRFEEALRHFERSHELSGRPKLLFNIGSAAERAGKQDKALRSYERYLEEVPEAENRSFVEGRIRVLRKQVQESQQRSSAEEEGQVPSPAQAAQQASATPPSQARARTRPTPETTGPKDDRLVTKWWLWTGVGAVAAGAIVAGVVVATGSDGGPAPPRSDIGQVIRTLGSR
jgi:tetratricopeptide (TPR) repeat protein